MSTVKPVVSNNKVINSFWTGAITDMERLCIKSYLDNGHEFHLYTYEALGNLPVGTTVKDANEVIPREQMDKFANPQQFADHFRYTLLYRVGGWWMDMDTVCLRPFKFDAPYVFALAPTSGTYLYNGFLKVPANDPLMEYCMQRTQCQSKESLAAAAFQDFGPTLVSQGVRDLDLHKYILPGDTFDPVHWDRAEQIIDPSVKWDLSKSYCVHLFHAMWNNGHEAHNYKISPWTDGAYQQGCLYEKLKRRYLNPPRVSIVITAFNRSALLRNTLESFASQSYKDYEVIVVDDGNAEHSETKFVCDQFDAEYVCLNNTVQRNPAYAINFGVRKAAGDVIILQNAECKHIDPCTIEKLANVPDSSVMFARVMGLKQNGQDDWLYCGAEAPRPFFFCGAIKKVWFYKIRGMDEDYPFGGYDDNDFADRLRKEGVHFDFTTTLVHHQWHPRPAGMTDTEAAAVYNVKTSMMANGTLGTVRNLNREWGGTPDLVVRPAPVVVPPKRHVGNLKYSNNGLTLDWWDSNPR